MEAKVSSIPEYADLLSTVELFAGLDRITLAKLAARLTPIPYAAGSVVVREGEPGDSMYVVASGQLEVVVATDTAFADRRVATLETGAPFGEMALLTNQPRAATVRAVEAAEVLRLERSHFLELIRQQPEVAMSIAATLSRRLRMAQSAGQSPASSHGATTRPAQDSAPVKQRRTALAVGTRLPAWLFFGLALLIGWTVPAPLALTASGWHALVSLLAVVPLLALGALPEGILALMLAGVWVIGGVAPLSAALGGFASTSWVLLVSVLVVGTAVASSGVLYRLALWTVAHTPGGFTGQALALGLTGLLLGPAAPNATGRITLVAPALTELSEALGFEPRSRASAGLAMAAFTGFGQMTAPFLTSSTTAVLVFAVLPAAARTDLTWTSWAVCGAVLHAVLFTGLMAAVIKFYRPREPSRASAEATAALALQRALLGKLTRNEYLTIGVTIGLLLGFVTQSLHGIHPAWLAVGALAILGAAGVVTVNTFKAVNWSFVMLFGVLASMSAVFTEAKLDAWVAHEAAGAMQGFADYPAAFLALFTLACMAVSFVLRWQAAAPLLTIAIAPLAGATGIHAIVIGLIAVVACSGFFMPYQSTIYLALYHGTEEKLFSHAQVRPFAVTFGVMTLVAVMASIPYWRYLGLL